MTDLTTLQTRLTEAESAYHSLMTGALEASAGEGDMRVAYAATDAAKLAAYIADLRAQVGDEVGIRLTLEVAVRPRELARRHQAGLDDVLRELGNGTALQNPDVEVCAPPAQTHAACESGEPPCLAQQSGKTIAALLLRRKNLCRRGIAFRQDQADEHREDGGPPGEPSDKTLSFGHRLDQFQQADLLFFTIRNIHRIIHKAVTQLAPYVWPLCRSTRKWPLKPCRHDDTGSKGDLRQDRGYILDLPHPGDPFEFLGDDNGIARVKRRGEEAAK